MIKVGTLISIDFSKDKTVCIKHSFNERFQHEWKSSDVPNSAYKTEELEFIHSFIDDIYDKNNVYRTTYMPYRKDPISGLIYLDPDNTRDTQDFIYIVVDPKKKEVFYGLYMKNKPPKKQYRNKPKVKEPFNHRRNKLKDLRRNKEGYFQRRKVYIKLSISSDYI